MDPNTALYGLDLPGALYMRLPFRRTKPGTLMAAAPWLLAHRYVLGSCAPNHRQVPMDALYGSGALFSPREAADVFARNRGGGGTAVTARSQGLREVAEQRMHHLFDPLGEEALVTAATIYGALARHLGGRSAYVLDHRLLPMLEQLRDAGSGVLTWLWPLIQEARPIAEVLNPRALPLWPGSTAAENRSAAGLQERWRLQMAHGMVVPLPPHAIGLLHGALGVWVAALTSRARQMLHDTAASTVAVAGLRDLAFEAWATEEACAAAAPERRGYHTLNRLYLGPPDGPWLHEMLRTARGPEWGARQTVGPAYGGGAWEALCTPGLWEMGLACDAARWGLRAVGRPPAPLVPSDAGDPALMMVGTPAADEEAEQRGFWAVATAFRMYPPDADHGARDALLHQAWLLQTGGEVWRLMLLQHTQLIRGAQTLALGRWAQRPSAASPAHAVAEGIERLHSRALRAHLRLSAKAAAPVAAPRRAGDEEDAEEGPL